MVKSIYDPGYVKPAAPYVCISCICIYVYRHVQLTSYRIVDILQKDAHEVAGGRELI